MDWNRYYLRHENIHGIWRLLKIRNRYHVFYEEVDLGGYSSPSSAFDDLLSGSTFWPECGDPSLCDLPDEMSLWELIALPPSR